jgi:BRCA1-associated protein
MGPSPADALAAEKVEAIGIEYSYLLTSQLDSQRAYYEEEQTRYIRELEELHQRLAAVQAEASVTRESQARETQESKVLEERATKAEARAERSMQLARRFEKDLKDERAVSQGLMETIASLKAQGEAASKEMANMSKELQDVRDQMRDVMFYLEARDKIGQGGGEGTLGEAAGGSVSIATPELPSETPRIPSSRKRPKKKKT